MAKRRSGFTLIEALVAVTLLATGVVSVMLGFGRLAEAEGRARETEATVRFAWSKLEEIKGTADLNEASLEGDFADRGRPDLTWSATIEPSAESSLDAVIVEVVERSRPEASSVRAVGVVWRRAIETMTGEEATP